MAAPPQNLFDDETEDEPTASEPAPLRGLSEPAQALLEAVAGCVPIDSSFDCSQRITEVKRPLKAST